MKSKSITSSHMQIDNDFIANVLNKEIIEKNVESKSKKKENLNFLKKFKNSKSISIRKEKKQSNSNYIYSNNILIKSPFYNLLKADVVNNQKKEGKIEILGEKPRFKFIHFSSADDIKDMYRYNFLF